MKTIEKLKEEAKVFNESTKKFIPSCTFAAMNVNNNGLVDMWGDFKNEKGARKAITAWGVVAKSINGKITSRKEGSKIRVVVDFQ